MKWFECLEWISLNVVGVISTTWIASLLTNWSSLMAILVGISIIIMNVYKIQGIILDNKLKNKELNDGK